MSAEPYILIVDDDPDARRVMDRVLGGYGVPTRLASNGEEAVTLIEKSPPILIMLDLMMPGMNGFDLIQWLKGRDDVADIPVIVVSAYLGSMPLPMLSGMTNLEKSRFRAADVQRAVSKQLHRDGDLPPPDGDIPVMPVPDNASDSSVVRAALLGLLSEREMDVLRLIARGHSNEEIALELFVTINTVKTHIKNIYDKMGVNSRTQAVAYAHTVGLLE